MTIQGTSTRWWENYLVRYLMPSIAGLIAVNWLGDIAGAEFRKILHLPSSDSTIDGASLTLLFIYGNLFCYVASYPILVFHSTRVLDFRGDEVRWDRNPLHDGYLLTTALAILTLGASLVLSAPRLYWAAFFLALAFAGLQLFRLSKALKPRVKVKGLEGKVSLAYALAYALARKRSLRSEQTHLSDVPAAKTSNSGKGKSSRLDGNDDIDDELVKTKKVYEWRPEMIDTYRHMREHGNSAFIFVLELTLAALVYCVLARAGQSSSEQLTAVAILFGIWAFPSIFVHLAGQQIERRFSQLEKRIS